MKKSKKKNSKLWIHFALIVFAIMLATAFVMMILTFVFIRLGHFPFDRGNALVSVIPLLFLSVIIGTAISLFVAKKILHPITKFSKAVEEVAKGNFSIRLDETERIEEIRALSRNFNLMAKELSSIEMLRKDFVVNISHEFKTPIAAIEGYAMLLQDKGISETERNEYTQIIIDSARQLATLADNILRISKLENQEVVFEKEPFRLDEQIRQAVLMLEPEWSRKELNLHIEINKFIYYGNEQLLWQVWINLIGNAIKFTSPNGNIGIQLFQYGTHIIARISDTGCGMDDDVLRHIFDTFYQGDTSHAVTGNGLGLAMVKRIIELYDATTEVESEVGKGSKFTVKLPYYDRIE